MKVTTIETIIVETQSTVTASQVVHELSVDQLRKEERLTAKYIQFEKGKRQHDLTHYIPRFDGMNW